MLRGARRDGGSGEGTTRGAGRLRVCLIADPFLPVPPRYYGGIERVIAMVAEGLMARGHRVTLFAAPGSALGTEVVTFGAPPHLGPVRRWRDLWQVAAPLWRRVREWDVIHSFGRLAALLPVLPRPVPKLQSYQREITLRNVRLSTRLARGTLLFTACSDALRRGVSHVGRWVTVPNGAPAAAYRFSPAVPPDAPLMFLGRIERIKGTHTAIAVARAAGRRLIIAGNVPPEHRGYFEEEVQPHLDGTAIRYVGPVDDAAKNEWLGRAAALLMPIEWEEPFGIVMVEALACGTPVIGLGRGAVPEVVEDGITGFVCGSPAEMVEAVARLPRVERAACRASFQRRFSDAAIVDAYLQLYRQEIARTRARVAG